MSTFRTRLDRTTPGTAVVIGVLVLLGSVSVLDRGAATMDTPKTITGTVIAPDPDGQVGETAVGSVSR